MVSENGSVWHGGVSRDRRSLKGRSRFGHQFVGHAPQGEIMSPGWIVLAIFVALVVLLIALTSRRQRLHSGSRRVDQSRVDIEKDGSASGGSAR